MILTLLKEDRIFTATLPEKPQGQFFVRDIAGANQSRDLLGVLAVNGKWQLRSTRSARVLGAQGRELRSVWLEAGQVCSIRLPGENACALLFAEEATQGRQSFEKYSVAAQSGANITIGRAAGSAIVFDNHYVSQHHAALQYMNGRWSVQDTDSVNHTFVNTLAVRSSPLAPGDVIYMMGLTIVIGGSFLAINNPNRNVRLDSRVFRPWAAQEAAPPGDDVPVDDPEPVYFYRSPHFRRGIEPAVFEVDAPPAPDSGGQTPLVMLLGPSITMGMASVATGAFSVASAIQSGNTAQAAPSMVMAGSMLLGTLLWPLVSRRYEKKKRAEREALRQEKYTAYLQEVQKKIRQECADQAAILREEFVTVPECLERIRLRKVNLWERTAGQEDFLRLRLGLGKLPLNAEVKIPAERFELESDNLKQSLCRLRDSPRILDGVPITLPLAEDRYTAFVGRRGKCLDFANGLAAQLCALHGYDEVKLVFLYDKAESDVLGYAKWLPHCWSDDRSVRWVATDAGEMKVLSAELERTVEARLALDDNSLGKAAPYYVIFAFNRPLAMQTGLLKKLFAAERGLRMSVLCFFDELKNVPKECGAVVEIKAQGGLVFNKAAASAKPQEFTNDVGAADGMAQMALALANTPLDLSAAAYKLPKMITFLEMLESGSVEQLSPPLRWRKNDPTQTLQAVVGVNEHGDPAYLDLHEKFHGPHGLVAGMTGSGKSEFIITYILSMAVNYHPDEVAFVLIDFKGGGMAKAFENMPHTAGIITNLDGAALRRSLVSIDSELKRRQAMFQSAGKALGVSKVDIYKYQKAHRDGQLAEPLPHLIIIADEFAELKAQQPDFMEKLVSAARIGRELGVHLILATQKPDGVVDDQIWSNSRFKVCLKVQDTQDSVGMLKRPDAAELKDTGRFYLQVGYNEIFELGQSAWAGAPYFPSDSAEKETDPAISVVDMNGRLLQAVKLDRRAGKNAPKQLDAVTAYITRCAREEHIQTRQLWLPPMEAVTLLDTVLHQYPGTTQPAYALNPVLGEYDDPARQARRAFTLPLSDEGNAVIYGFAGAGKATLLTTLLYHLLSTHTPETLHTYIMDFGAETLRGFAKAPQVGDVVLPHEGEKVGNLLKLLREQAARRKKLFADFGGDYAAYCGRSGRTEPNILLMINNYGAFRELFPDEENDVCFLAMEGKKVGIYVILTATTTNAVNYRVAQNFKQLLVLQLNDPTEYSGVLGNTRGVFPAAAKGRGIARVDGEIYEFQTAYCAKPGEEFDEIHGLCGALAGSWDGPRAPKVPVLPEKCGAAFLADVPVQLDHFPIGVNQQTLEIEYMDFTRQFAAFFTANDSDLLVPVMRGVAELWPQALWLKGEADLADIPREAGNPALVILPSLSEFYDGLAPEAKPRFEEFFKNGKAGRGVSLLVFDDASGLQGHKFDAWFTAQFDGSGVWVGDGAADQFLLSVSGSSGALRGDNDGSFAALINKGKYRLVKVLQGGTEAAA